MNVEIKYLIDAREHVQTLAKWICEEWNSYDPTLTVERATQSLENRLNKDRIPLVLIVLADNDLAGSLSLKESIRIPGYEDREVWLGNFIVAKNYRNRGIGSLLLKQIRHKAKELGFKKISLFTTVPEAVDWYLKKGWRQFAVDTYQGNKAWLFEYIL